MSLSTINKQHTALDVAPSESREARARKNSAIMSISSVSNATPHKHKRAAAKVYAPVIIPTSRTKLSATTINKIAQAFKKKTTHS